MTEKRYSLGRFGCYRTRIVIDNKNGHELGNSIVVERLNVLHEENKQLKQRLELYAEIYPTGKWITELNSEELEKELEE